MKAKHSLLIVLLSLSLSSYGQQTRTVQVVGRVVEMVGDKYVGIPNVKVAVPGQDDDITLEDGSFKLTLLNQEFAVFSLANTTGRLVSPVGGEVYFPPYENLQIVVCNAENKRLLAKTERLERDIAKLKKEKKINDRRIYAYAKTIADTTLFFEQKVLQMEAALDSAQQSLSESEEEIRRKKADIVKLMAENESLRQEVKELTLAHFLKQQQYFEEISRELNTYRSALEDLRKNLGIYAPDCTTGMFPRACQELETLQQRYSNARDQLFANQSAHLSAVRELWADPQVGDELEAAYALIFNKIHDPLLFRQYNDEVAEQLRRKAPKGKIKKACGDLLEQLAPLALELQQKTDHVLNNLGNNF